MRRIIFSIFLAMLFCLVIAIKLMAVEYPAFVFGHWVWEDEGTSQSLRDLVKGYRERGIPVSAVIIDSPWETSYNSFEFDRGLYPDYEDLLSELEGQGISVILWITCAVNQADPDYEYALENGYFAPGLEEVSWWKGVGGLIDYENPEALNWWHERMNNVMALPFDGWKADGIDGIIALKGLKKRQRYAEKYYSDFYHYTRERTGRNTVIMARGIEIFNEHTLSLPGWVNPFKIGLPLRYAPREVSFATWMGDQDPTWNGMRTAYRSFRKSAEEGYLVPGFDIFGYREGEKDKEVFLRWAQWGAFSPLMENGGIAEHRPWEYDEETVEIYRHYAIWHEELGWYLYTAADERFKEGLSLVEPLRKGYLLGHDIYVQPIMRPGKRVSIELPQDCWRDWNHLENRYCSGKKIGLEYGIS
jgi:alpha-glucosidase (family GH31 glycosyl hydrolase)